MDFTLLVQDENAISAKKNLKNEKQISLKTVFQEKIYILVALAAFL